MRDESQKLYEEGLAFLKQGQREKAADTFKKAIEDDSENIDIWVALSQALDDIDEKRIALTTILQLDPNNEYAKSDLVESEKPQKKAQDDSELVPGIKRSEATRVGLALAGFTLVMCAITFLFMNSQSASREAVRAEFTAAAVNLLMQTEFANGTATQVVVALATEIANQTATQRALVTPTIATRVSQLPTSRPPTATPTEVVFRLYPPPPDSLGISGRLWTWGGRNLSGDGFLNFLVANLPDDELTRFNDDNAKHISLDENGMNLTYLKTVSGGGYTVISMTTDNTDSLFGTDYFNTLADLNASNPVYPRMARLGGKMVLIATLNERQVLFLVDLASKSVRRITPEDGNDYLNATISPDGTSVIAVKRSESGTDLVLINAVDEANAFPQIALTNDGDAIIESLPDFGSDGARFVFVGASGGAKGDIYLGSLSGTILATPPQVIVNSIADETTPTLSPDGRFIAYSSDENGIYNIYLIEIASSTQKYQLTEEQNPIFVGSWTR
jgi:tetratricopeptide (TPR) repeat protein